MTLPPRVVLPIRPAAWRTQPGSHCGAFAVQAVLQAYGLNDVAEPWDLHTSFLSRMQGSATSRDYYPGILRSFGLVARSRSAESLRAQEKILLLKRLLAEGNPVILSVGSYFDKQTARFQPLKGLVASHWISLWGYDDEQQSFYVYDSLVTPQNADDVAIGNKARSFDTVLRIWPGSLPSRVLLGQYSYIHIRRPGG
jgi:hypothetical protein